MSKAPGRISLTQEEAIAAIYAASMAQPTTEDGAFLMRDLRRITGRGTSWLREWIRGKVEAGDVEVVRVLRKGALQDAPQMVLAYRFKRLGDGER